MTSPVADLKKVLEAFQAARSVCAHDTERIEDDGLVFLTCRKCGMNVILPRHLEVRLEALL